MTRENAEAKGARYVACGRLFVVAASPGHFLAVVRGSGELHTVRYGRGGWSCDCAARGRCSHLHAAALVAAPDIAKLLNPERTTA